MPFPVVGVIMKASKIRRRWGVWGWFWRLTLALVALLLTGFGVIVYLAMNVQHKREALLAKPQREYNLIVYDAFVKTIEERYYDPTYGGIDWPALAAQKRAEAGAAENGAQLYFDVMTPLARHIPTSHVAVTMREGAFTAPTPNQPQKISTLPPVNGWLDYGFDAVGIRRKGVAYDIVGDVRRGSPADKAGIEPGWLVNVQSTKLSYEVKSGWRGHMKATFAPLIADHAALNQRDGHLQLTPEGWTAKNKTELKFQTFEFDGKVVPYSSSIDQRRLLGGALYIRFDLFDVKLFTHKTVDQVMAAIDQADARGVVIDLRNNTGGDVEQVNRFLSRFLPPLTSTGSEIGRKSKKTWRTDFWSKRYVGPVVVLIGPQTASGGEVAAANLKAYHRATVIGRTTNGSVLASRTTILPDGGNVQVAEWDYLTPSGQHIESVGVAPDIELIPTLTDIRAGHDPVLERAEQVLAQQTGAKTGH